MSKLEILDKIMDFYLKHPLIKLLGFHSHIGSQITEVDAFIKNAEVMIELSKKLESKYNYPITDVNLGGGFGIKYTDEVVSLSDMLEKHFSQNNKIVMPSGVIVDGIGYLFDFFPNVPGLMPQTK